MANIAAFQDCSLNTPVLLVHGLFSRGKTWQKAIDILQNRFLLTHGGELNSGKIDIKVLAKADLYTWNFSHKYDLSYREQARQLAEGIDAVKRVTGSRKIALLGHSMGGLAARAYLQLEKGRDISTLITIGTPHYGSPLALLRGSTEAGARRIFEILRQKLTGGDTIEAGEAGFIKRLRNTLLRLSEEGEQETIAFFNSEAFLNLAPGSAALEELNQAPFPKGIKWVFLASSITRSFVPGDESRFYRSYLKKWHELTDRASKSIAKKYLSEPYRIFEEYIRHYLRSAPENLTEQLIDSDGVVPFYSQMIHHLPKKNTEQLILPINISHNRQTKHGEPLYMALAAAKLVGP